MGIKRAYMAKFSGVAKFSRDVLTGPVELL